MAKSAFSKFTSMLGKSGKETVVEDNPLTPAVPVNKDYQVVGGTLKKYLGTETEVSIPSNLGIVAIGERAFFKRTDITNVRIPIGVTSIGNYAFAGCDNLKHILLSNTVTSIGNYAFENCKALEGITLPEEVTSIGSYAFSGCKSLVRATLPENIKAINNFLFNKCESLNGIIIPESVTNIGWSAFAGCSSIDAITIPSKVTTIGNNAFQGCSFSTLDLPSRVGNIGEGAFFLCANLESITIDGAADGASNSFVLEDGVLFSKDRSTLLLHPAKVHSESTTYTIPSNVSTIGYGAFSNCDHYETIEFNDTLQKIDGCAFFNCSEIKKLHIPESVVNIGKSAFQKCTSMISITLPSRLTVLETGILSGCENLVLADIPENVSSIGYIAFFGCKSLSSIEIPDSVHTINKDAFSHCNSLKEVTISKNVSLIDKGAFSHCAFLERITVDEANTEYSDIDGVLFNKEGNYLLSYPAGRLDDTYTIPDGVDRIGDAAFMGANNIVTLTLPSSIQMIGTSAFSECIKLTDVYISENITNIGTFVFSKCRNLDFILLPSSIRSIEPTAFAECDKLTIFCDPTSYGYKFAMDNNIRWSSLAPEQVCDVSLVKSTHKTISLTWKEISGKVEYQLFVYDQVKDSFELAGRTTSNEYTFEYLKPGTVYIIKVAACRIFSTSKFMGSYSEEITVMTNPGKVENLSATINTINSIVLSWNTVTSASEYHVYMLNGDTDIYDLITTTKTNKVLLTGLTPGTNNQYKVMAITNYNSLKLNGPYSDAISTGTSIGVITGLKALSTTSDSITIYWDEINDAYRYIVYQLNPTTGKFEELESTQKNTLLFEELEPGTEYSFKVACVKMFDRKECIGTPSNELVVCTNLLAVRGAMMASHTPTTVKLNWVKVNGATGYEIVVFNPLTNQFETAGTTDTNSIVFTDLTPMQTYKYKIMAIKEVEGEKVTGTFSAVITADTIC